MVEAEALSRVISAIYDSSLEAALWPAALEATARFLRSATATLGSFDALQADVTYNFSWGDDPAYTALYLERYARLNPLIPASLQTSVGEVASVSSIMTYEELHATQVYQEWAKPQGYIDVAQATLEKSGTALAVLAAVRHESVGPVDSTMLRRMKLLVPHFRRAVLIGKVIDLRTVKATAFAETIDGLAAGIFLVDHRGVIVHANASGKALLDEGTVVTLSKRGTLKASDDDADRRLGDAIAGAGGPETELAGKGIGMPLFGANGQSHIAHILPLASGARQAAGLFHAASAAVFLHRAELDLAMPVARVARRYGLTPTEEKVLRAVVQQGGVTPVAAALGMGEATVKTHLQRVFQKTGTRRQVDLVKLTFSFADPLARPERHQR